VENNSKLGRRRALQIFGAGLTAGGLFVISGCKKEEEAAPAAKKVAAGPSCQTKEPLDETSRTMRRTLQYMEKSNRPGKLCSGCSQYETTRFGPDCGGCKLFTGAVNPNGSCLSFAPIGEAPPAAPGAPAAPAAPAAAPAKGG
jgi:hypothetical protein